ncbi:hypothetical protein A1Q1_04304 [Trichosporon asahii var. asahii CBS 2479]|uniref:Uncharacterized protein n=1 Tax=Trichosporon asahii var. asahii (strain ATCC 90039 / CBS 2479 / JCM 2466 / KCTC 7840 / NBRC 103889/ NCYC 2677 / UAMH 7654) TaxID=1186058 RepID=J5SR30_TRIAS|nr:hypothetical protein A1Q1_04304 [Trichosporon asahii var. asahii CBS 2479]EJT47061.1 hypothetical protein A1Q1_04304 [Trichosporon asahii var. asahii CBS 2479]
MNTEPSIGRRFGTFGDACLLGGLEPTGTSAGCCCRLSTALSGPWLRVRSESVLRRSFHITSRQPVTSSTTPLSLLSIHELDLQGTSKETAMVAPPPAANQNNLPPEGGLVQDALLGMKYKYIREQPTTLVVTITPQGKGHPNSYHVVDDKGLLIIQTKSDGSKTNIIFDGEGGELLCMSPNLITMHHSISGTHGGQDVYKGSVHSGYTDAHPAGGESEYRATYTNHDTNVTTEVDYYGPWEEHDGKIIDHSQQDRVLANVCRENIFDSNMPRIAAAGPGTEYFLQVVAGVDLASVATIAVGFDMILERDHKK